jgi:hypothetical protein
MHGGHAAHAAATVRGSHAHHSAPQHSEANSLLWWLACFHQFISAELSSALV